MQGHKPYNPNVQVRHLGPVAAGYALSVPPTDVTEYRQIPEAVANDYPPDQLFTLDVTGDSMTDSDSKFEIPQGCIVVMRSGLDPTSGDIVPVRLENEGTNILKLYRSRLGTVSWSPTTRTAARSS